MSTMPEDDPCGEKSLVADQRLHNALVEFMASVGSALGVCSYGLIIGDSYVPFDPDEEDEEECVDPEYGFACEQGWVRVAAAAAVGGVEVFDKRVCAQEMQLTLEVGVLRCFPVNEEGRAPDASTMLKATLQSMDDMNAMYRGAMSVDDDLFDSITAGSWAPLGPLGGQYGGVWDFTVTL